MEVKIIGKTKYSEPDNAKRKLKLLRTQYKTAEWFAGRYSVINDKSDCFVVGTREFELHGVLKIKAIDDFLIVIRNENLSVFNDKFKHIYSYDSLFARHAVFNGAGRIYGYLYMIAFRQLLILDKRGKEVLPDKTVLLGEFDLRENECVIPIIYSDDALDTITIRSDGTTRTLRKIIRFKGTES